MEKTIVSYQTYNRLLGKLIKSISESTLLSGLKYIYGPPRGGLPIAVHLSHYLDLTFVADHQFNYLFKEKEYKQTIVVDDIADTGKTIIELQETCCVRFTTATLFLKDRSLYVPDFWVIRDNNWVIFPWEKDNEIPNR